MSCQRWKEIPGFPGNYVSDQGQVVTCRNGLYLPRRLRKDKDGYLMVDLRRKGRHVTRKVHHLVLEAFVGPKLRGLECDHINTIRDDNRLINLHWVTPSENKRNPITRRRREVGSPRNVVRCVETGEVFISVSAAARRTGASRSHIGEVCKGKAKSTGGLRFVYVEVYRG